MTNTPRTRFLSQTVGMAVILFAVVVGLSTVPVIRDLQLRLTDTFFRLAPAPQRRSRVVLVLIDDESLHQYGRWPWSRELLARLTTNLAHAGAGVIGLDILLSEVQSPSADRELADALRAAPTVVVDKIGTFPDGPHWIEPLQQFSQAAAVGHAQSVLDQDSVCRRFPPRELTLDGSRWAFAVEVARRVDAPKTAAFLASYRVPFLDETPVVSAAQPILARIAYRRDGFEAISARSVLQGDDLSRVRGRPVVVGFGPTEIGDRLSTPLTSDLPTPGVEVHAHILDGILDGRIVRELPLWFASTVLLISCVLAITIFRRWRGRAALGLLLGLLTLAYVGGLLGFALSARILPLGPVMLVFLLAPLLVYSADFVLVERSVTRQLLGLRFWLASQNNDGPVRDEAELSWKLDLLHKLQTELGALYELHKTLLESTQDLVAIFDERGRLLLNNQAFAAICQPEPPDGFTLDSLLARLKPAENEPLPWAESSSEGEVHVGSELYSFRRMPLPPTTISPGGGTIIRLMSLHTRVERDRARAETLGFITHELRTPLVSIQGFAELLIRYPNSPSCVAAPETIFRESKRLLALINSYLDVLRLDAGAKPICVELVKVDYIVREVFDILQPLAAAAGMHLQFDSCDPGAITGDETLLRGVLLNLVSNAIKYGKTGTGIRVGCFREVEEVTISVDNEGELIAPEDLPRVFDPYYRGSNAETGKTGWGLGLAFVKRIAEKHGGSVSVESGPRGNSFLIHLPTRMSIGVSAKQNK
jgi:signal transduction histidine kinase